MTTIAIAIQKGGSGKTTTCINLAAMLRDKGKKVLLIDLDPQANLTQSMNLSDDLEPNIYHLLKDLAYGKEVELSKAIHPSNGMDVVASSLELASAEIELVSIYGRERLLNQLLTPVKNNYDFIFIDCPPAISMLTVNALTASDQVLIPLQAEFLPFKGLQSFMRSLEILKKQLNPKISVLGYLLTKFDRRKIMNNQVLSQMKEKYGDAVFETCIRSNIALAQAQEKGIDIFSFNHRSNGAKDYEQFTLEFMNRIKKTDL